jgi:hypothetical protein
MENILLTICFVELGKRETRSHNTLLPFIEIGDAPHNEWLTFVEIRDAPP